MLGVALAGSCGGSAFTTGAGADAGGDGTSSGADGGDGGGADASQETSVEASMPDAPHDVADELSPPPPACGGTLGCVPAAPPGWAGPLELYAGTSNPPSCTADFAPAYAGNGGLTAPAAGCSCSCGPSTTQCAAPTLTLYSAVCVAGNGCTCTGTGCDTVNLQAGACTMVDGPAVACDTTGSTAMSASASAIVGGSCAPDPGQKVVPISWETFARACSSTVTVAQVDCKAGSVCAPEPMAPYGAALCISQAGDLSCPVQGYTSKQLFYGGVDDQRGCTACTCGSPTGASCDATLDVYMSTDGSCTGTPNTYGAPFSCDVVDQPVDLRFVVTSQNGSCAASPVGPTGAATPTSPTTFCCLP